MEGQSISEVNEVVQTLKTQLSSIQEQVSGFLDSINKVIKTTEDFEDTLNKLTSRVQTLETRVTESELKCLSLERQNRVLSDRITMVESQSRRDNLLLDGVAESPTGCKEDCFKIVRETLQSKLNLDVTNIKIIRCHRLGPPPQTNRPAGTQRPRPIIFRLHCYSDRQLIWESRTKLKDTNLYLNEDFPKEISQRRKTLIPIMKAARKLQKIAFLNVDKLHIQTKDMATDQITNKTVVTVDTLHRLPPSLDPRFITTARASDCFAFFGELCPLSNFHKTEIMYKGKKFHSSEQVYQYRKAEVLDDQVTMKDILLADTALESKRLGDKLKENEHWRSIQNNIMTATLRLKFNQNAKLKDFLKQITEKTIAEASPSDLYWGTGAPLSKAETTEVNTWKGSNHLGIILQNIRAELRK